MSERSVPLGMSSSAALEALVLEELGALLRPAPRGTPSGSEGTRGPEMRDPLLVLSRLLDAVRERGRFEAVAMADDTGCIVAGAGAWSVCEELAAHAPLLAAQQAAVNDTVPTRLDVLARRNEVRRLSVDGIAVFLCGCGGASSLEGAARECERALRASRAVR